MTPDQINAIFQGFAALFILNHCRVTLKDKAVKGVSLLSVFFFLVWGFWDLYFYSHLQQWWSLVADAGLVLANLWWIRLIIRYRRENEERS